MEEYVEIKYYSWQKSKGILEGYGRAGKLRTEGDNKSDPLFRGRVTRLARFKRLSQLDPPVDRPDRRPNHALGEAQPACHGFGTVRITIIKLHD
jgi:hypothetical protein